MERSTILGLLGILVSIGVGVATYYLAERKSRRSRWQGAKDTVLRDLSKSLGEGSVPEPAVILATIRSVLRSQNAPDLAAVTLEEVKDDLLRQITADAFLDADRRKQLQSQVLSLKPPEAPPPPGPARAAEAIVEHERRLTTSSFGALLAGVLASLLAGLTVSGVPEVIQVFKRLWTTPGSGDRDPFLLWVPIIAAVLTLVVTFASMLTRLLRDRGKNEE